MLVNYVAINSAHKTIKGSMQVDTISDFYKKLDEDGLSCIKYTSKKDAPTEVKTIYKLKTKDLVLFCRKMSTMMSSGMSITNSLDIMVSSSNHPKLEQLYLNLYENIKGGKPMSEALRESGKAFPLLLINMIESGEESGNVDIMFLKLGIYFEKQAKTESKIKTATTYPKLLAVLAFVVVIILFAFVLPEIFNSFGEMELPLITVIMMGISNFLKEYWYLAIAGVVVLFIGIKSIFLIPTVKKWKDKLLLKIPKIGSLLKKIFSARFSNTLAILYASGLSLLNAIRLSTNVVGNSFVEEKLLGVMQEVSTGNSLSESLEAIDVFDNLLPSMVRIGEETGSLDAILTSISEYYDQETETAIEALLAILEPILLIIMAIVIGSVLVGVMLPIFSGYGTIG